MYRWPCQNLETSVKTQKLSLSISCQCDAPSKPRHGEVPTSYCILLQELYLAFSGSTPKIQWKVTPLFPRWYKPQNGMSSHCSNHPDRCLSHILKKKAVNINKDNYIIYVLIMKFNQMLIKISGKSAHIWKFKNTFINNYEIKGKSQVNFKNFQNKLKYNLSKFIGCS